MTKLLAATPGSCALLSLFAACLLVCPEARGQNFLLNVDFGSGPGPSRKTGPAATGQATTDFWNYYTRDDEFGNWRDWGTLENLKLANGTATTTGLSVANAPGAWGNQSTDPMYEGYIYPFDGGNITLKFTNVPPGVYDLYVYGSDARCSLSADNTDYPVRAATENPAVNPPVWTEGKQYVRFSDVALNSSNLVLTVLPGSGGYAIISGLQLVGKPAPPPPASRSKLINVDFGAFYLGKLGGAAIGQSDIDFWNFCSLLDSTGPENTIALRDLKYADGTTSPAELTIGAAAAAARNSSADPMYTEYVFAPDGASLLVTISHLPAGDYDLFVYSPDGAHRLQVDNTVYPRTTHDEPVANPPVWEPGRQYALFTNVTVRTGDAMVLSVGPGAAGRALLSGLQLRWVILPPVIVRQPQSQEILAGSTASFSVEASGTEPLQYQWRFNGQNLAGAKSPTLSLTNVQTANAGLYSVVVSNTAGMIISSNALLSVTSPPAPTGRRLINVDFGASDRGKTGLAATGLTPTDFWNVYSRDDEFGRWKTFGWLQSLKYSDRTVSPAGLTIDNAPGAWGNGSSDPMYVDYLYPFNGGNVTVLVTNLPPGTYDFYIYSHDGNHQFSSGMVNYGVQTTRDEAPANSPAWQKGRQYALFPAVPVTAGQPVRLTITPGAYGLPLISGMQIETAVVAPKILSLQPANQLVSPGGSATFVVQATGTAPLSYQWRLDGTPIPGATNSTLTLINVRTTNTGRYSVVVSNAGGSVTSVNASLGIWVWPQVTPLGLINIDFGAGPGPSEKVGMAALVAIEGPATGTESNAFWNFYTRDENGGYRTFGAVTNLLTSSQTTTRIGLTVSNAPGMWGNGSTDPMYSSYIYPFNGGNAMVTLTNLPPGTYNVYVYGNDGKYQINTFGTNRVQTTWDSPLVNPPVWTAGKQYTVFRGVTLTNRELVLTVLPGRSGYATISGMQVQRLSTVPLPGVGVPSGLASWAILPSRAGVVLRLTNSVPVRSTVVYSSTNLSNWAPVSTIPPTNGPVDYVIPANPNEPQRFYYLEETD